MKLKMDDITVKGHKGTWYVIGNKIYSIPKNDGGSTITITLYLLEHEQHGEDAASIIVMYNEDYERYDVILENVYNSFSYLDEFETVCNGIWVDKNSLIQARIIVNNI